MISKISALAHIILILFSKLKEKNMKDYLLLYKSKYNDYYNFEKNIFSFLQYLRTYYCSDYRYYDANFFEQEQHYGNETIIVNDAQHKNLYISPQEFDIDEYIADDDRPGLTNEFNSCKISYDNFIEFRQKWIVIKETLPAFAIIYRDNNDWIDCKGFDSEIEMKLFVQDYKPEVNH